LLLIRNCRNLASIKSELKGTVKFIFQPAEEGAQKAKRVAPIDGGGRRSSKSKVDVIWTTH
jgi:metal-dependent amidase/aminoacylase/carboxypeptidase family protein